jgi:RNA polymerase sigma-32 factor
MSMVHAAPTLTREAEQELLTAFYGHGDLKAKERLVLSHLRYVVAIALKYRRYGLPLSELIAEGNFGIVHALGKFEPARGNRFVTYAAYWIRAYILNYVIRSWSLVGVGSGALRSKVFFKLRRERAKLMSQLGDSEAVTAQLAERMGLPAERVEEMLRRLESRDLSLDARGREDSEQPPLLELLVTQDPDQEHHLIHSESQGQILRAVQTAVSALDRRERYIVEKRLMSNREDELSLAEIGRQLGVSRERARQLEARAKKKLRAELTSVAREAMLDSAA